MKSAGKMVLLAILLILGNPALSACRASTPEPAATLSVEAIQTSAVGTFVAELTQTALAMPTDTPTSTATSTPTSTPTLGLPFTTGTPRPPTASCYGLTWIRDVTIPDNTPMVPGQTFTKTWLVKNTGACAWEVGFKLALVAGDAMGGTTLTLNAAVNSGAEKELSVAMTAPNKTGTVQGTWRMSTAAGIFFGDIVFVIINVGSATSTPTATSTAVPPTATPTDTVTP